MNRRLVSICSLAGLGLVVASMAATVQDHAISRELPDVKFTAPASVCFAPGTPDVVIARFQEAAVENLGWPDGTDFNTTGRWTGSQGNPITIRYSFPADGLFIPSGLGEPAGNNNLNAMLTAIFGSAEAGKDRLRNALAAWNDQTGISYIEVTDNGVAWGNSGPLGGGTATADIRIVAKNFGGAWNGVLAYNNFPQNGDMVINQGMQSTYNNSSNNYRVLRNTISHENGHGIGLLHVCPVNSTRLMEPFLNTNFDLIRHDDLRGGQRHYGDNLEANDTAGTATDLGSFGTSGVADINGLSLDDDLDIDWFRINVGSGAMLSVNVSPVGFTYQDWDQLQNGNCATSGPTENSLAIHDLRFEVRAADGTSILVSRNATGAGSAEILSDFVLPTSGDYYVRVLTSSTTNSVQIYDILVEVDPVPVDEILPDGLSIVRGIVISGGLNELISSNDQRLVVRPDVIIKTVVAPVQIRLMGHAFSEPAGSLTFELEAQSSVSSTPRPLQRIFMFNFDTQTYEVLDSRDATTSDSTVVVNVSTNPGRFVSNTDGEIRALIQYLLLPQSTEPPTWQARIDFARWILE